MLVGVKYDTGKLRWSLVPWEAMTVVVWVLQHGAEKYGDDNWKRVDNAKTRYWDALMRHAVLYQQGEKIDPDTGLSHMASIASNALFLLWFELKGGTDG